MNIPQLVERKFLFASDQPITAPLYEIVIARNGVFKRARRREMTASVELSAFSARIPELAAGIANVELLEKIPARIFSEILAHARNSTDDCCFTENLYALCRDFEAGGYFWKEVSRHRSFGSAIARDDDPVYQTAVLEIHTHPPGCRGFSSQDTSDESGKFRLFGILVDIHSAKPAIRLRVGIYDTFGEIPVGLVTDAPPENLTDLVKQESERLAEICSGLDDETRESILAEDFRAAVDANMFYLENL
jgi:hypothetical protein